MTQTSLNIDTDKLAEQLTVAQDQMSDAVAQALVDVAGEIESESIRLTPIDTGELRSRSFIEGPLKDEANGDYTVVIGYEKYSENYKNPYAVPVHERTYARHHVGQAKFLETAIKNKQKELLAYIQKIIKREMESS